MLKNSSIAAERISYDALSDLLEIWEHQPWATRYHRELTELWNICDAREEQNLLKNLIKDFYLLDSKKELSAMIGVSGKIKEWQLDPDSSWLVAVANKDEIDGSAAGLQKLKNKLDPMETWHSRCISNIPAAVEKINNNDSVILFDDFIGTGDKLIRKAAWLRKLLEVRDVKNITLYFASFAAMSFGLKNIIETTACNAYAYATLQKAISEKYPPEEAAQLINIMKGLESKLATKYKNKKLEDYSLGYRASEALYCGENDNCPNNVFPILWWPELKNGNRFNTLLKRAG